MKSRSAILALAALLLLLAAWFAWRSASRPSSGAAAPSQISAVPLNTPAAGNPETPAPAAGPARPPANAPAPAIAAAPAVPASVPPVPPAGVNQAAPGAPNGRAQAMVELEKVHNMIASYHTLMGQNPVGTNAEIMKALMGGNPRQATLGPPPGQSLNAKGELVDPWGTPYFFHQLSGDDMEIHSAGPDRIMGTADDLVIP